MAPYTENEIQLQREFYNDFLPRVDSSLSVEEIQTNYTDGLVNGNLLEFKTHINELNPVLFQAVKYLSAMRIRGIAVPANILLISANQHKAYLYHSADYLEDIEKVYAGGASRNNAGFTCKNPIEEIDYNSDLGKERIIALLKTNKYTRINIDENCIVGWASRYYAEHPEKRKQDFIGDKMGEMKTLGEIRRPDVFKQYINAYTKPSNKKFEYLMDKLNDTLQKKNLGAFYTHPLYAKKSLELLRMAVKRVPEGNDYIILDRCAGTGNLERYMTDEELSHTIISTVEYYEYKVLLETFGDKVRHFIPPTEKEDTFNAGLVNGADALSEEYLNNEVIMQYVNNPNCSIILFENPPYADTTSIEHQKKKQGKSSSLWKKSFVVKEMCKDVKGTATNDLGNAFIWSAFKYYLRQPTDSYVVYSPVKYWKVHHLINKDFINGFAFNRRHFHTNIDACIMVALWSNIDSDEDYFQISAFDLDDNNNLVDCGKLDVKRIYKHYSKEYFDKRKFDTDIIGEGIVCEKNGVEKTTTNSVRVKPIVNDNIIGYLAVYSSGFDNPDNLSSLLSAARYDGNGFYLRSDNYLTKLPMFAASRYVTYNRCWTERARIMKSADGAAEYNADIESGKLLPFLQKCLLFTCLEMQNHVREFTGSDGRYYHNQFTLDTTNGSTLASIEMKKMKKSEKELQLIEQWEKILYDAKQTAEYNPEVNYGLFQIAKELDTSYKNEEDNKIIYNYPSLHGNIQALKPLVRDYYLTEIVPVLFEYQFLK